jgi:hypothetical protein
MGCTEERMLYNFSTVIYELHQNLRACDSEQYISARF